MRRKFKVRKNGQKFGSVRVNGAFLATVLATALNLVLGAIGNGSKSLSLDRIDQNIQASAQALAPLLRGFSRVDTNQNHTDRPFKPGSPSRDVRHCEGIQKCKVRNDEYPEFAVSRESLSNFFSPPLAKSTFYDLVNRGKIFP